MRQVRVCDVTPTPWRNGGGTTRELLAWPDTRSWRLRLSVADIVADGPFSAFPGVTRGFVVLEGAGVTLDFPGGPRRLHAGDTPLMFDGAATPGCRLISGPVRDFNLMARGGRCALLPATRKPWQPPRGARAGLFALSGGTWRQGHHQVNVPGWTLLTIGCSDGLPATEDEAGVGDTPWTFEPDLPVHAPGWWFFHEDIAS